MPQKKQKKQKKTLTKKTKLKSSINVKINIDNSKKTTARRTAPKAANMQPFANFPSYQPARVQQLEPIKKYESPDFTKTGDMYQDQIKVYLKETTDKAVKEMIEKYDDTLKKKIQHHQNHQKKVNQELQLNTQIMRVKRFILNQL